MKDKKKDKKKDYYVAGAKFDDNKGVKESWEAGVKDEKDKEQSEDDNLEAGTKDQ